MARCRGALTLTEKIYNELRQSILLSEIPLGTSLKPMELKERYNVSLAVIREVLIRLATEGLVKQNPNLGFSVLTFSTQELQHIYEARILNECEALRLSIAKGDLEWETNIIAKEYQLRNFSISEPMEENEYTKIWSILHYEFHRSLIAACPNKFILDMCDRLWYISELYRSGLMENRFVRSIEDEHKSLMEAVISKEADKALILLKHHLEVTIKIILKDMTNPHNKQ